MRDSEHFIDQRRLISPLKGRLEVSLVTKTKNAPIFSRQAAEERRAKQQRVVTLIGNIVGLKRNVRIMIAEKDGLARLEDWYALAMNRGGVEHEYSSGGA